MPQNRPLASNYTRRSCCFIHPHCYHYLLSSAHSTQTLAVSSLSLDLNPLTLLPLPAPHSLHGEEKPHGEVVHNTSVFTFVLCFSLLSPLLFGKMIVVDKSSCAYMIPTHIAGYDVVSLRIYNQRELLDGATME